MGPVDYDFNPHYRGDALNPFRLLFKQNDEVIDFTLCTALMQLRVPSYGKRGKVVWEFSTEALDSNKLLVLTNDGYVNFPAIPSWDVPQKRYIYDLQITDRNGNVKTFTRGVWPVNQDISQVNS